MNSGNKQLREYIGLPYTIMLQRDEEGDFIARVKELDGCVADGQDEIEALANIEDAKEFWISAALKAGREIPKPDNLDEDLPSGKWLQRVPRSLHRKLTELAKAEGVSLNQLVLTVLAEAVGEKFTAREKALAHTSTIDIDGYSPASTTRGLCLVHRAGDDRSQQRRSLSSESIAFAVEQIPENVRLNTPVGTLSKSLADMERSASGY